MNTTEVLNQCSEIAHKCSRKMADICYVSPKGRMVVANTIFLISGIVTLAIGLLVYFIFDDYNSILHNYEPLPLFYISTAVIIFVMVPLGLFAVKNSRHLLKKVYIGAMFIIFIFHIATCIAGYVYQIDILYHIWNELRYIFPRYQGYYDYHSTWLVDRIQKKFYCCGVDEPKEWLSILNTTSSEGLPLSCCSFNNGAVHIAECTIQSAAWRGCGRVVGEYYAAFMWVIGTTGAVLATVQVLLILLVMWAGKSARSQESDEKELLSKETQPTI